MLKTKLYEIELEKQQSEIGATRKSIVRTGDRSEKIRTYNYPQSRVTDHRIGYTQHNLPAIMNGDLDNFVEQLRIADSAERMMEGCNRINIHLTNMQYQVNRVIFRVLFILLELKHINKTNHYGKMDWYWRLVSCMLWIFSSYNSHGELQKRLFKAMGTCGKSVSATK